MKRRYAIAAILAASSILCGFQQASSPEHGKANQEPTQASHANANRDAKNAKTPTTTQSSAESAEKESAGIKANNSQEIRISTPEKSADFVERIISIIGVICTIALAVVGIVGICIAIKTLREMKGQRRAMLLQLKSMRKQSCDMRRQANEMEKQTIHLEGSVSAARSNAEAAKISADIAAGVSVPRLVVHEFDKGNMGGASLEAMLQFPKIKLVVRNYGQTPAFMRSWSIVFTCDDLPLIPEYYDHKGSGIVLEKIVIQPNEFYMLPDLNGWQRQEFSLDDVDAIIGRKKIFNVYDCVCYRDIFGNPTRRLKFCETALNFFDGPYPHIGWVGEAAPAIYRGTDLMPISDQQAN